MDLYVMEYVLAVAEHRNFSLGAQACHVGQPALSQQIAKLERELGVTLFHRNSRGAVPTQAGQAFVLRAQEILQRVKALESEMALHAGVRRGTLNLGMITSLQCIDFGNLLTAFCAAHPGISVNITQSGTHNLIRYLLERKIDLAFLNYPPNGLPNGVQFQKLGEDCYALAVPENHELAGKKTISLSQLKDASFIFHQAGQVASELCYRACRNAGFEPNIVCRCADPTTGFYMVQGGLGVALLPKEEFSFRTLKGVVQLQLEEPIIKEVGMAWRTDAGSPLIRTAVEFAGSWTKE